MPRKSLETLLELLSKFRSSYYYKLTTQERLAILKVVNSVDFCMTNPVVVDILQEKESML